MEENETENDRVNKTQKKSMQSFDSTHTVLVNCTIDAISNLNDACQLHEYSREAKWLLNERLLLYYQYL